MKPRLFWTMLLAFALVILLGVCGMLGFFGLAFVGVWQPPEVRTTVQEIQTSYAASLGDYYVANGDSWAGVDERLSNRPVSFLGYALADKRGQIIASDDASLPIGQVLDARSLNRAVPIQARGKRVGTLVVRRGPPFMMGDPMSGSQAPQRAARDVIWPIVRSFLVAGLILAGGLLLLAVVFAQRLSRPLRDVTQAAQQLAAGRLDVQVRRAPIREVDELTQAFNAMARSLSNADRQRRQMTADIAHELRTPLTIIKGRLEGVQDGVYAATPVELERLLHEVALLERLIEDLRLLALAEAGQLPLYREVLDPRDLLEAARATFAGQAATQGITLAVEAADDVPLVDVDPQRMAQVLANLVANALRYTAEGGAITLSASETTNGQRSTTSGQQPASLAAGLSSMVILKVRDTGQGIPAEDLPNVFDRFYRADRARARGSGGAGLGLAIAKQIVAAHGGEIWAESEEGRGTTIGIALGAANPGARQAYGDREPGAESSAI